MKNFALSSTSSTYTPPSLEGRGISFILREPNEDEMEKLSTELFRRGCVPVEQGRMRAVLIDELYHLFDEAAADEKAGRSEEHTSELQSLMRISYAVFCLTQKKENTNLRKSTRCYTSQTMYSPTGS